MQKTNSSVKKKADLKIVILGDANVGKTCFVQRYIERVFTEDQISTLGASFFLKQWGPYNVAIWDTAGEEKFAGLSSFYCRGASAAIVAYEITSMSTFQSLHQRHIQLLEAAEPNCLVCVVGTKRDLLTDDTREVPEKTAKAFATDINQKKGRERDTLSQIPYFETSAKTGANVDQVFDFILHTCLPLDDEKKASLSIRKYTGVDLERPNKSGTSGSRGRGCCSVM